MEVITKSILKKRLYGQRIKKKMLDNMRLLIEEFKHHKLVNKRFIDAIKNIYPDMHAYQTKNEYKHAITVRWNEYSDEFESFPEIYFCRYHTDGELTWQHMLDTIERYRIEESIARYENMIEKYDADYQSLMNFKEIFNSLEIVNFTEPMHKIRAAIEDIQRYAYRDR